MIYGIGIDVEETARFRRLVSHVAGLARVYGPAELAELQRRGRLDSYAANFCAKEAFSKALGTGVRGFSLNEAELLRDALGKPYFKLSGCALRSAQRDGLSFSVSVSHSREYAAAVVVAEKI